MPKISELPIAGTLGFSDSFPVVQGGVTDQATVEQMRRFIGVRVTRTTSSPSTDLTPVSWHTADFDTDSFWDAASGTRLTAPYSGFYDIGFTTMVSTSNQGFAIRLRKNGAEMPFSFYSVTANGRPTGHMIDRLNPGDYYEAHWDWVAGGTILNHSGWYMNMTFLGR